VVYGDVNSVSSTSFRSDCPINASLETIGDKWSLIIVRDMVYFGKSSFNEFLASDEEIARNILADRLNSLQAKGLVNKESDPRDRRKDHYRLTVSGLDLIPVLLALAMWGRTRLPQDEQLETWYRAIETMGSDLVQIIRITIEKGGAVFVDCENGVPSVIRQIGLR